MLREYFSVLLLAAIAMSKRKYRQIIIISQGACREGSKTGTKRSSSSSVHWRSVTFRLTQL